MYRLTRRFFSARGHIHDSLLQRLWMGIIVTVLVAYVVAMLAPAWAT